MNSDERGIDTVFGALMLILTCMVTSAAIVSIPDMDAVTEPETDLLEAQFDCILSSSIELPCSEADGPAFRTVPVSLYLIEIPAEDDALQFRGLEECAREAISSVVDFYMSRFDGWTLELSWDGGDVLEVASRSPGALEGSDATVLERTFPGIEGGSRAICLTLAS